ncbi:hypothetical protein GQ42DRAFT_164723 [Ramicandelaber brevisporus]|nr:hypothetical protein GQ42DRAFT_164723 [Ramicandelaber brevisporus]
MGNDFVVFIPRHYPKDNDCWRGIRCPGQSEYRPVTSFDPDLYALARDLERGVVFFAVFYGTHFLFVERRTMRSFKCAYGHHRKVLDYLFYEPSGAVFTEAFTNCINKAAGKQSSDGLLRMGDLKPPHAVLFVAGLDLTSLMYRVFSGSYSTDEYPCAIQNVSEVDLQDISAMTERVRTDERGLNQDFFNIVDDETKSRFVKMDTGEVFQCYHLQRQDVVNALRSDLSMFSKYKEMAEECDNKVYRVDMREEPTENFLYERGCDGKLYAMDGTELKDGDVVHMDIVDDYGSVGEFDSALCGSANDASEEIGFRVRVVDGKWYLREALEDGSDGRYLSVEANEECGDDYLEATLKSNNIPAEEKRIVFRRHKKFKHVIVIAKAISKDEVAYVHWVKSAYGAIAFDADYGSRLNIQFIRGEPL